MENVFARSAVFAISILLCSMLIIGCTQNQPPAATNAAAGGNAQLPPARAGSTNMSAGNAQPSTGLTGNGSTPAGGTQPPSKQNGTTITDKVNSSISDNKTAYDKNQTVIAQLIADGTYVNDISYRYPRGTNTVTVDITVKNDTITAASVAGNNVDMMSARYISNFNSALPDLVVGKKINELSIPRNVAGSSLTTAAFAQYVNGLITNPPAQG